MLSSLSIIITFLTLILLVIFCINEGITLYKKHPLIFILLLGLILIIFYYLIKNFLNKNKKDIVKNDNIIENYTEKDELIEDHNEEKIEDNNIEKSLENINFKKQNLNIELSKGILARGTNIISYDKFKDMYKTEDFCLKFAKSIKSNCHYKRLLYSKMYKKISTNHKDSKNKLSFNIRNLDDMFSIDNTLKDIKTIFLETYNIEKEIDKDPYNYVKNKIDKCLYDSENGCESLIGRDEVKHFIARQLYTFAINPKIFFSKFQNIIIYAPAGFGKTKIAKVISFVYSQCGITLKNNFIETTKSNFTTGYINESGPKTQALLFKSLESVLFIDEAYEMTPSKSIFGNNYDHGGESITELVNFLDKYMGANIVIACGYQKAMKERFLNANQGMQRRFPNEIYLTEYNSENLTKICLQYIYKNNNNINISKNDINYLFSIIDDLDNNYEYIKKDDEEKYCNKFFKAQAGDMLNLAGDISTAYYSNLNKNKSFKQAIADGFNIFLSNKNLNIRIH